jgi:hypothetical protein
VNKKEEREPEAGNEFLSEIHSLYFGICEPSQAQKDKRRAGRQEKRNAVLCGFRPLCLVRDQRCGAALTASWVDGDSPVSKPSLRISKALGVVLEVRRQCAFVSETDSWSEYTIW